MQSRRMMVLRAVVEDYIKSKEPVGSASLAKNHNLGVSSATIRNDMSALEEEGYLVQPHTSAGRIPTEKGYRYFVDGLAAVIPLSEAQRRAIRSFLSGSVSLQDTLQRSAKLLASITGQVALVASPALSRATVRHIEIVQVSTTTLLVVVITDTGGVAQHMLQVGSICAEDLYKVITLVNEVSVGCSLKIAARKIRALSSAVHSDSSKYGASYSLSCVKSCATPSCVTNYATADYVSNRTVDALICGLADALDDMHNGEHAHDLYVAGASQLAHRQTMTDFASLFDALEEQAVIMRLMTSLSEEASDCANGVSVAIGSETHTPGLLNASIVTSGYGYGSDISGSDISVSDDNSEVSEISATCDVISDSHASSPVAFIGSIGPQHMDYVATMGAVKAVAKYLNAFISKTR